LELALVLGKTQVCQILEVIKDFGTIILPTKINLTFISAPILLFYKKNQISFGAFMDLAWKCIVR